MDFRLLTSKDQYLWHQLIAASAVGGFMQSLSWAQFKEQEGWKVFPIGVFDGERLVGGALVLLFPFSEKSHFLYVPQGPIFHFESLDGLNQCIDFLRYIKHVLIPSLNTPVSHLRVEPRLEHFPTSLSSFIKAPFDMQPRSTLLIDLCHDESTLLSQMKPKARYNISVAERHGISIQQSGYSEESLRTFYSLYYETSQRQYFSPKPPSYFTKLMTAFDEGQASFFFARKGEVVLGVALIIFFGGVATYFFGASSSQHREMMASYLLHWHIMQYAKSHGCHTYDFWGIASDTENRAHPWFGFTRFKRQFGGTVMNFSGSQDLVYDASLYEHFLKESGERT